MNAGHLIRALCIDRTPSGVRYLDSVLSLVADTPVAHVSGQEDGSSYINRSVHPMFLTPRGPYPVWGIHGPLSPGDSMKAGQNLGSLLDEVERVNKAKRDYLVPSTLLNHSTRSTTSTITFSGIEPITLQVGDTARRQLAEKLGIPYKYFERMRDEQPGLLDNNVNTWLGCSDETRMIRALDGQVRAVLSNRYHRRDNFELAKAVIPILRELPDARVESCALTADKLYIKVVTPRVEYEISPGDVVCAGVVISNSETGMGSVAVSPLIYRLVCKNGLIAPDATVRRNHVGRALNSTDDAWQVFSDQTLIADDTAFFMKMADVVRDAVSVATFESIAVKMAATKGIVLKRHLPEAVELLCNRYALGRDEQDGILRHLAAGADFTGYGLVNAVTGFSQEVPDYERATELEFVGGQLVGLENSGWATIAGI